ncbi:MAG: biopolymer transporter ExbD [Oscillatoriaceae bacterium SKW80]|nr:biopolymer transporter ExbD [Oscillatoriaceae bacterium SKYG93]MCX8121864.1 biopolymer transporter ExbD [Oscillatoriaceae bacterium SKW80]MDW8454625.1 biopolymer transporter ExbD [Oscillatoriaceae cyanobacterium SKYGB_i_bin93]HIK27435.1 biopolymer transporter ExbD [Oscillatoriaceae cyanobacterium M7585_C2015_266]
MKIKQDIPGEEVRIELVPLIDVIFCILTFFLIAALQLTRQQAITVDLPKARTGQRQTREMLIVSILNGQTYIEKQPVSRLRLFEEVKQYHKNNPGGITVLYASKDTRYNDVVQVLDMLRVAGRERVALATLPGSETQPLLPSPQIPFNPAFPNLNLSPPSPSNTPATNTPLTPNQLPLPTTTPAPTQPNLIAPTPSGTTNPAPKKTE